MKILKTALLIGVLFAGFQSCTINFGKSEKTNQADSAFAYQCPMHCKGSGSDSAGTCPVCNMEYIKVRN